MRKYDVKGMIRSELSEIIRICISEDTICEAIHEAIENMDV